MRVAEGGTAAVGVDGLVAVIGGAAFADVLPAFAVGQVPRDLGGDQMRGDDEVVGVEDVDLFGLDAGDLVDLTDGLLGGADLKVRSSGLAGGAADAEDLDGLVALRD